MERGHSEIFSLSMLQLSATAAAGQKSIRIRKRQEMGAHSYKLSDIWKVFD